MKTAVTVFSLLLAVLLIVIGASTFVEASITNVDSNNEPNYKKLDEDQAMNDLQNGKNVVVRTTQEAGHRHNLFAIEYLGHLPKERYHRYETIFITTLKSAKNRLEQQPKDYSNFNTVVEEATDLYLVAFSEAQLDVLNKGEVFFGLSKKHPELNGWIIGAFDDQRYIVDKEGNPTGHGKNAVWERRAKVFVPVQLNKYPSLLAAIDYLNEIKTLQKENYIYDFNMLPYKVRKEKYLQSVKALNEITQIGNQYRFDHPEVINKKVLLLPFNVDPTTMLGY